MKLTKEKLLSLIYESLESEVDEMAAPEKATWRLILLGSDGNVYIGRQQSKLDKLGIKYRHVGWLQDDTKALLFTDFKEFEDFAKTHEDFIPNLEEKLNEQFGQECFYVKKFSLPAAHIRNKKPYDLNRLPMHKEMGSGEKRPTSYMASGQKYNESEVILRGGKQTNGIRNETGENTPGLNKLIETYLGEGNSELNEHLKVLHIPKIKVGESSRSHLNNHGVIDNQLIQWGSMNFYLFEDVLEFRNSVMNKMVGSDEESQYLETSLARQYNKIYQNWDKERKNKKEYWGKTPIYLLNAFGLEEKNYDLSVVSQLSIKGTLNYGRYIWTITFITRFGKKLKDDLRIKNGLEIDKDLQVMKNIDIDPSITYDAERPIIFDPAIREGLIEAMKEMSDKIMEIEPFELLDKVNVSQADLDPNQRRLNEMVNRILKMIN